MRIGIDARLVYYQREGGIAQYTLRLLQALVRMNGADEFVILHQRNDQRANILESVNGAHNRVHARRLFTPSHHRYEQWALPIELWSHRLAVLHSPDFIPPFRRHCASVITVHDLAFKLYPRLLTPESAVYYGQIERAVQSANQIIAVSEATRRDMLRLLQVDEKKITVIYEAADPLYRPIEDTQAVQSVIQKYQLTQPFVLFVGTIEPRKNIPLLLRAFRQMLDQYKVKAQLVLAGKRGWLSDEVFTLINELQLGAHIKFLGPVSRAELLMLYNAARLFVMPSLYEGFGLPPLEAMSCGLPLIASDVSSLPEIVGDAGLYIAPADQSGLADAIYRLLADDEFHQALRQKGLQRARMFSWDRAARETLAVYHRAVD